VTTGGETAPRYLRVVLDITVTKPKLAHRLLELASEFTGTDELGEDLAEGIRDGDVWVDAVRQAAQAEAT